MEGGRASRRPASALHPRGQAPYQRCLDFPSRRRRTDVHRHRDPQRGDLVDARPAGHGEPARDSLHGRDLRVLSSRCGATFEGPDAHASQAGTRLRSRGRPRHSESRGPRLQRAREHRHLVSRPPPDGPRSREAPRRVGVSAAWIRPEEDRRASLLARQARLSHAERSRGRPRPVRDALGDVVSGGTADAAAAERAHRTRDRDEGRRSDAATPCRRLERAACRRSRHRPVFPPFRDGSGDGVSSLHSRGGAVALRELAPRPRPLAEGPMAHVARRARGRARLEERPRGR